MIAILYPLKMTKNLYEAYSAIYEISADKAIEAAKKAEKTRAEKAKAGDTEGAKKAMGQNTKFFNYAKGKRQQENAPKTPTGPMVNKPTPDPRSSYPGTPQIMKQGKIVKNSYEPEGEVIDEKLSKEQQAKYDAHVNQKKEEDKKTKKTGMGPAFDDPSHHSFAKSKIKKNIFDSYDNRYSDNTGKESKEKLKKLEKKRGMSLKKHPQFTRDDVGKFRKEWEALKLVESDNYREQFDTWLDGIVEEGYDIDRWTDEELLDTFINENDLWESRESVSEALLSEADKKGKGSGKKDACYHKVKASASVWPSAYASGRLVQCRKKGAANYGNSKKEDFSDWRSDIQLDETPKVDKKLRKDATPIKPGPLYKLGRTKEQMGDKAVISRRNLRNAMSRGGVGSMTPAKETAERREKHKAARGVKKEEYGYNIFRKEDQKILDIIGDIFENQAMEAQKKTEKPDPQLAAKEKKANMAKKQVLMKKLQAVRMGAGSDIQASHEPNGEVVSELNRFEKEKGMDTKTGKPVQKGGSAKKDLAFQAVMKTYGKQRMGANQPKKVKGAKSDVGTGRVTQMLAKKKEQQAKNKAIADKAKKAGYKSTQDYVNVQAVRKGGLGT